MRSGVALIGAGAILLTACAGGPGGANASAAGPEGRRIQIEMREFIFNGTVLSLARGERVTLVFHNRGVVEHEFMAGRQGTGGRGYAEDLFSSVEHEIMPSPASDHGMGHDAAKVGVRVAPAKTASLTFVVPDRPGTYEFGCFVAGHYEAGMKGALQID